MKIFFGPLHYLDDKLLIDAHRAFHMLEKNYQKNKNTDYPLIRFIYDFKDRINWFHMYHERLVSELNYRFGYKPHSSPPIITPKMSTHIWTPSEELIEDDILYLKHRYKFSNKTFKYTKRTIPDFLKEIKDEERIYATCKSCIYFSKEYDKKTKPCPTLKHRKEDGFCENWDDGSIKYRYEPKNELLKYLFKRR